MWSPWSVFRLLLNGILLGFLIAAPVGPIGVLCIRRTLALGKAHGLVSGLGAATADGIYGFIALFGLSILTDTLTGFSAALRLIGGLFLLYLGVTTFRARPADKAAEAKSSFKGLAGSYLSTVFLTLTNPATILSFVGIFLPFTAEDSGCDVWLGIGVPLGSALWWLLLSGGVSLVRERFTPRALLWVNRASGLVIAAFAVSVLLSMVLG